MKKIILIILIISVGYFGYQFYEKNELKKVSQEISKTGYMVSIKSSKDDWNISLFDNEEAPGYYEYSGGIYLSKQEKENIYIDISYELKNNGDDTPHEVGDTGGGLWPPQPDELIMDFEEDKYMYLGNYLGKELYVEKNPGQSMGVYQKLNNGKITANMPLLSKDKNRVNYYDYFSIIASARGDVREEDYKKLHKEFIKILKTMKIEKIES